MTHETRILQWGIKDEDTLFQEWIESNESNGILPEKFSDVCPYVPGQATATVIDRDGAGNDYELHDGQLCAIVDGEFVPCEDDCEFEYYLHQRDVNNAKIGERQ